jgi:HEAT repeat protein
VSFEAAVIPEEEGHVMKLRTHGAWLLVALASTRALSSGSTQPDAVSPPELATREEVWEMLQALGGINGAYGACESVRDPEVVSVLCSTLDQTDLVLRRRVVLCLGSTGEIGAQAVPFLIRALEDPDRETRSYALSALGQLGPLSRSAVPSLARLLQRHDYRMARGAISALARIGSEDPAARQVLFRELSQGGPELRRLTAQSLGFCKSLTSDVVAALTEALADDDIGVRTAAAESLSEIGPEAEDAVPALLSMFRDGDEWDRSRASGALAAITRLHERSAAGLLKGLQSRQPEVRVMSALSTAFRFNSDDPRIDKQDPEQVVWDPSAVVPGLIEALEDPDSDVVAAAARALGNLRLRAVSASAALHLKTRDKSPNVRRSALHALESIDGDARDLAAELLEAMHDKDDLVRAAATRALGDVDPRISVAALSAALRDPCADVRLASAVSLGTIGVPAHSAIPLLASLLTDPDQQVRWAAVGYLEKAGPAALMTVPDLAALALDPEVDAWLRSDVIRALPKIDPGGLVVTAAICDVLTGSASETEDSEPEASVRLAAVSALDELRASSDAVIAILTEALADQDPNVVNISAYALARMGAKARRAVPALRALQASRNEWIVVGDSLAEIEAALQDESEQ